MILAIVIASLPIAYSARLLSPPLFNLLSVIWILSLIAIRFRRYWRYYRVTPITVMIIGGGVNEQRVLDRLHANQSDHAGYHSYQGSISATPAVQFRYKLAQQYRYLGDFSQLAQLLATHNPDCIYITDFNRLTQYQAIFQPYSDRLRIVLNWPLAPTVPIRGESLDNAVVIEPCQPPVSATGSMIKAILDRVGACVLLLILSPVFLLVAVAIKLSSSGPVLFYQDRLTQHQRVFKIIKFRTMINTQNTKKTTNSMGDEPVCVNRHDPRISPLGRWLRLYSLDELPQLINIIRGDMSFVGPRPERPHLSKQYSRYMPHFSDRYAVKAGLTGWAQINGRAYLTNQPRLKLDYDLYYIYHWSLGFDLKILGITVLKVIRGESVYA